MTRPYSAEGKECHNCGEEVEYYTGHWEASEVTICEVCEDEVYEEVQYMAEVVHVIPRAE